jgi:hypothetical protein
MTNDNDYKDFADSVAPSANAKILDGIHLKISQEKPSIANTAMQMGLIHIASSLITLMICPQFGVRIFFEGHGLMGLFMRAGSQACFLFCGAFYLGVTFLIARNFMQPDSWILIRKVRALFAGALALLSMGALTMIGQKLSFELGLMWFLGAYVSAWLTSLPHPRRSLISNG